jgi:O-antigen ligase
MIWLLGGYMWLFVHRPFEYWPALGALQLERAYMLLMLVAWLVLPGKGWVSNRIHAALAFFTVVLIAAWVLSPYMNESACSDVVENYFKVAVFYVLVITTVRDERGLRLLVLLFLGAVGLYMAHSMLEFYNGRYQWRMGIRRMIGVDVTFSDPNIFASSLLYSLPMTLPFWAERPRRPGTRLLLAGYTLSVCGCIALTGSRTGFIGLCLYGLLVLLITVRRKAMVLLAGGVGGAAALALAAVALPGELQNRYLTLIDPSYGPQNAEVSASGRMDGFLYGIEAWQKSPLLGHGPSAFGFVTNRGGQAHNLYGQILSEMGLLGALALAGLLFCFQRNWAEARRYYRGHPGRPRDLPFHVSRAVGLNVVLLLVMGWAGHNAYRYNWQWFAAFQAIAVHCVRRKAALPARARALPYLAGPRPRARAAPRPLPPS